MELTPYTTDHRDAVQRFAQVVSQADGVDAFGEQTLFNLTASHVEHFLVFDDQVLAYAQVDNHSAELAVHPDHRREGIGGKLLEEVKTFDPTAAIWAHGNLSAAQLLAHSRGLKAIRELVYMTAELDTTTEIPVAPEGIVVQTFTEADGPDWLKLNAQVFSDHPEQGRLDESDLADRLAQPWFDPTVFWLARDASGKLLAAMWVKREPGSTKAEIYVLGVSSEAQGRGLGKFLTDYSMAHMAGRGVSVMDLYVEGDNTAALATYLRYGFSRAVTHVQYR